MTHLPFIAWLLGAAGTAAWADPPGQTVGTVAATGDAATTSSLEQIIVSADKRNVDLEQAPVAVSAIGAAALEQSNITQLADLNGMVPGLTIAKSSGFERIATIRGVGSETPENAYTTQPGVSFHIDGVYVGNSISLDETLFDVDHIEVSRGPQATVFGQTSTGGTINIVSRQPELGRTDAYVEASAGSYDLWRGRGMLNVPLGETLALRMTAQLFSHEGFASDADLPGFRLDAAHDGSGKAALLWQPSDSVSATLTAQIYRANHAGDEQKNVLDSEPDPRVVAQDYPSLFSLANELYYLNLRWQLPFAELKSTSSWQALGNHIQQDGTRFDQAHLGFYDHVQPWDTWMRELTQELSLASRPGNRWNWVVGALYLAQINHQYVYELSNVVPAPYLLYDNDGHIDRHSHALYAQVTAQLAPDWRAVFGGRYNHDRYGGSSTSYGVTTDDRYGKGVPTGKLELQHDMMQSLLGYAGFTHGYKPGGVNDNPQAVLVPHVFRNEAINAYEIGSKYQSSDRRLFVNTAVYAYDYQQMQYIAVDPRPFQYGIDNLPAAHIHGLELESAWLAPDQRWRIGGNMAWSSGRFVGDFRTLDARAASERIAATPACASGGAYFNPQCWSQLAAAAPNTDGNEVPKLPQWQGAINAAYTSLLGGDARLISRVEYVYRGGFEYRIFNDGALDRVPGYGQWNLFLQLVPAGGHCRYGLGISNAFNVAGINSRYTDPYGTGQTSDQFIPPRQIIGTVSYSL